MSLYILFGGMMTVIVAAGWLWWRSYRSGKRDGRLSELDRGLQGLDKARSALDGVRFDPDELERLRGKYRRGQVVESILHNRGATSGRDDPGSR